MVSDRKREKDPLGALMKDIEREFTDVRLDTNQAIVARLDGRGFSNFTRGMERPFDRRMSRTMREVTEALMLDTKADVGYTQSDEISLVWYPKLNPESQFLFDGKVQKLTSTLAGFCSAAFVMRYTENFGEGPRRVPSFDCRIMSMSDYHAQDMLHWRWLDARKNSVQMLARHHFSHKELNGRSKQEQIDMLRDIEVDYYETPEFFRDGTTMIRKTEMVELTSEQLSVIPEKHRPTGPVERTIITKSCEI